MSRTDWCNKGALVLFGSQHENGEDELSSQKHLDEETLDDAGTSAKSCADIEIAWEHAADKSSGRNTSNDLSEEQESSPEPRQSTNQAHAKGDGRVEETTTDTEEDPCVDGERKAKGQSNVLKLLRVGSSFCDSQARGGLDTIRDLSARQGKVEEEHSADEFTTHGDEVVADTVWDAIQEGHA